MGTEGEWQTRGQTGYTGDTANNYRVQDRGLPLQTLLQDMETYTNGALFDVISVHCTTIYLLSVKIVTPKGLFCLQIKFPKGRPRKFSEVASLSFHPWPSECAPRCRCTSSNKINHLYLVVQQQQQQLTISISSYS